MNKKVKGSEFISMENALGLLIHNCRIATSEWGSATHQLQSAFVPAALGDNLTLDPFIARNALEELRGRIAILEGLGEDEFRKAEEWIECECERALSLFEERLIGFCKANEIAVIGHFPRYVLDEVLGLEVDVNRKTCTLEKRQLRTLSVDSIAHVLLGILSEEKERIFDPAKFLEELYLSYLKVIAIKGSPLGEGADIKDIFIELLLLHQETRFFKHPTKGTYSEYSEAMFSRDLTRLTKTGVFLTRGGLRLEFAPTAFSSKGIAVIDPFSGATRYLGQVMFRGSEVG
jgi:hypothetical protein